MNTVVLMAIGGLLVLGVLLLLKDEQPTIQIDAYNNTVIVISTGVECKANCDFDVER